MFKIVPKSLYNYPTFIFLPLSSLSLFKLKVYIEDDKPNHVPN